MTGNATGRIVEEIAASWRPIDEALAALTDSTLEQHTPAGWTAKEMLAHLAFWAEAVEGYMSLAIRLKPLPEGWQFGSGYVPATDKPWPHFEEHNAREAAWGATHSASDVRERLGRAHSGLLRFLASVTEEEASANEQYFRDVAGHYREHARELQALLAA